MTINLDVDLSAHAAYIRLSSEKVARTVEIDDSIMIDLDEFNVVVGRRFTTKMAPSGPMSKNCRAASRPEILWTNSGKAWRSRSACTCPRQRRRPVSPWGRNNSLVRLKRTRPSSSIAFSAALLSAQTR